MSITKRIGLLLFGVVLLTGLVVGCVFYLETEQMLVERELSLLRGQAEQVALRCEEVVGTLEEDARFLARLPPVQGIARAARTEDLVDPLDGSTLEVWEERLASIFASFLEENEEYLQVRYIGVSNDGRELVRLERQPDGVVRVPDGELQTKGQRPYVQESLALGPARVFLSKIELNREHGKLSQPHTPVLRASVAVFTPDGEAFGVIVINARWDELLSRSAALTDSADESRELYVTNREGDYLVHPDSEKEYGFDLGTRHRLQDDWSEAAPLFVGEAGPRGVELESDGERVVSLVRAALDDRHPDRFLAIGVGIERGLLLAPARDLALGCTLLVVLLMGMIVPAAIPVGRRLTRPLVNALEIANRISEGDLDQELETGEQGGEVGQLMAALQRMLSSLREGRERIRTEGARRERLFETVTRAASQLTATSQELRAASQQSLAGAQQQATAIAETMATVDEVAESAKQTSDRARQVADSARRTLETGQLGRQAVEGSIATLERVQGGTESVAQRIVVLAEQVQGVGEVVATVTEIADQTNLLALNAALEASRAGEHGRGFAVVAGEVRALSERAKEATTQVRNALGEIQRATREAVGSIKEGSESVSEALETSGVVESTITSLQGEISASARLGTQIAAAAGQQASGTAQARDAMREVDSITQQSLAASQQAQAVAENLAELALGLEELLAEAGTARLQRGQQPKLEITGA